MNKVFKVLTKVAWLIIKIYLIVNTIFWACIGVIDWFEYALHNRIGFKGDVNGLFDNYLDQLWCKTKYIFKEYKWLFKK